MKKILASGVVGPCERLWLALLLGLALLAGGCSTVSVGYNNAPTLINWYADSYFDLDADQETALKERLVAFRRWHRSTQLPDYGRLLAEVKARARGQVGAGDMVWLYAELQKRYRTMAGKLAPDAADLALILTQDNLAHVERKQAQAHLEYTRDFVNAKPEQQREKRLERVLSETERWYGRFSDAQRERIKGLVDGLPANYALVLEDRKRRQGELVAILRSAVDKSASRDQVAQRLHAWMADWERGRAPAYREFAAQYTAAAQKMIADVANLATPQQREAAQRQFQSYIDDIASLAGDAGS